MPAINPIFDTMKNIFYGIGDELRIKLGLEDLQKQIDELVELWKSSIQ